MPDVDIAIIGCGPVGALAANLVAARGLRTLVIDREAAPHPQPRAVHLDHEMMRLFQQIGLVEALAPMMREAQGHLHVGADHGVIRYMGTAGQPKPFGWANDYFFWQPELETVLRGGLARFPDAELRSNTELVGFRQHGDHVALDLHGPVGESSVTASWVIACDGARSAVRKALGVALDDLDFEEPWLVVDVEADGPVGFPDLTGVPPAADIQQLSVMLCDPLRPATVVPGRGKHRRWEFMLLPGETEAEMTRPERVAAMVEPFLTGVPHRILRASTYRFHGLIAERWRRGRVFLAGDAAHQTPPFFGQGMCHGMRDAANLAWKLDLVIHGEADETLLDTYQQERDPHVRAVVSAAVAAGRYICELDPAEAAARDASLRAQEAEGETGTAADLIPAIVDGVVAAGTPGAGERFIQPRLSIDGETRLLDDVTGGGWRLLTLDEPRVDAVLLDRLGIRTVAVETLDDDGMIADWLAGHDATAVLVRPDFYVFGTAAGRVEALVRHAIAATDLVAEPAPMIAGELS